MTGPEMLLVGDDAYRLGQVVAALTEARSAIARALKFAGPPPLPGQAVEMKQPLDEAEHDSYWLSRPQIYSLAGAAMEVGAVLLRLRVRTGTETEEERQLLMRAIASASVYLPANEREHLASQELAEDYER